MVAAALLLVPAAAGAASKAPGARITVRCAAVAFQVFVERSGQVRLVEYEAGSRANNWRPIRTTRVLAYIDAATQRYHPDCKRVGRRMLHPRGLVGPYRFDVAGKVFCSSSAFFADPKVARFVLLQFKPVLDARRRQVGIRLIATINSTPVVTVFMTKKTGGLSYDSIEHCIRNYWP